MELLSRVPHEWWQICAVFLCLGFLHLCKGVTAILIGRCLSPNLAKHALTLVFRPWRGKQSAAERVEQISGYKTLAVQSRTGSRVRHQIKG
jgi:hypothetical protein